MNLLPAPDNFPATGLAERPGLSCHQAGAGPRVVCLHSSTGSQAQWRALSDRLAGRAQVITPDLYGHGRSPAWPDGAPNSLDVDARAVLALLHAEPLVDGDDEGAASLDGDGEGLHLVGHSYGAAVAVRIALRRPRLVRSLTLYEPVLFGLLGAPSAHAVPAEPALEEIRDIARSVASLVRAGELAAAAQVFVGYWAGPGAWRAMTEAQQASVVHRIPTVPRHFDALFAAAWGPRQLQRLTMPVWLMHGGTTRASARGVADRLQSMLPQLQRTELPGAGHLGPISHAGIVADAMATAVCAALAPAAPMALHGAAVCSGSAG